MADFYKKELEQNPSQMVYSALRCPDGTLLVSRHTHNYMAHEQEDGRYYALDGGLDYRRVISPDHKHEDIALTVSSPHKEVREVFTWGNWLDKDGAKLPKIRYILLKDITLDHLNALIDYTKEGYPWYINLLFLREKQWRKNNGY